MKIDADKIMKEWEEKPITKEQESAMKFLDIKIPKNVTRKIATDLINVAINKKQANAKPANKPEEILNKEWGKGR